MKANLIAKVSIIYVNKRIFMVSMKLANDEVERGVY